MNSNTRPLLFAITLVIALCLGTSAVLAQDAQYTTAEYNEYQKAVSEGADSLIAFIDSHPDSALKQYAVSEYQQLIKAQLEAGKHSEAAAAGKQYLEKIDPESFEVLYLTTWSSFYSQQYEQAVLYGAKTYAMKPDAPQLESMLARSYQKTGNLAEAVPLAEKICAGVEPKDCYDLLPMITRHYAERKEWNGAAKWAEMTIKAVDTVAKPAQVSDADWKTFTNEEKSVCYAVLGRQAFEKKSWSGTEKNYETSRKLNPKNRARVAEGYYYTGMSRWNRELIDAAMDSFARGSLLTGTPHSKECRKQLEQLYKGTHNGSLAGLEEYLDRIGSSG
jgi:tetratricopeptide (TPR) repeat protein